MPVFFCGGDGESNYLMAGCGGNHPSCVDPRGSRFCSNGVDLRCMIQAASPCFGAGVFSARRAGAWLDLAEMSLPAHCRIWFVLALPGPAQFSFCQKGLPQHKSPGGPKQNERFPGERDNRHAHIWRGRAYMQYACICQGRLMPGGFRLKDLFHSRVSSMLCPSLFFFKEPPAGFVSPFGLQNLFDSLRCRLGISTDSHKFLISLGRRHICIKIRRWPLLEFLCMAAFSLYNFFGSGALGLAVRLIADWLLGRQSWRPQSRHPGWGPNTDTTPTNKNKGMGGNQDNSTRFAAPGGPSSASF